DFLPILIIREHVLFQLVLIVRNNAVGSIHDHLGRTVVLFQFEDLDIGIILLKIQDILDIGTTEGIDTLCIIPYHTYIFIDRSQSLHDQVLRKVGILVLIHHQVFELMLILMQYIRIFIEQHIGLEK